MYVDFLKSRLVVALVGIDGFTATISSEDKIANKSNFV